MRSIPFLLLIFLATSSITAPPDPDASIRAVPVMLDPSDPVRTRVGALRFLGGWELTSRRGDFGGISALHARNGRFLAVADSGALFRFTLNGDGSIADSRFAALPAGPGGGAAKADRDSEALTIDPASGRAWVGFERHNAIWRYRSALDRAEVHAEPPEMAGWPLNAGPEAMARLSDGRFVIICEAAIRPGTIHHALLFADDPARPGSRPTRFLYRAPLGYSVTDAAQLPDGRLLILQRSYSIEQGVRVALAVIDPRGIRAGALVRGKLIAHFTAPLTLDNMEALSIERVAGRTILWLASDDNFNPLQRTLLMKFELVE